MYTKIFDADDFFYGCGSLPEIVQRLETAKILVEKMIADGVKLHRQDDFYYVFKTNDTTIAEKYFFDNEEEEEEPLW